MRTLIKKLPKDFPALTFEPGADFCWSPKTKTVVYATTVEDETVAAWSLLHEVAHALLDHNRYGSDFELLHLEAAAWHKAAELAKAYDYMIDGDHIQDCLDTYRDWLHQRSTCPVCGTTSLQETSRKYRCHNCSTSWTVTASRFCRPYRRLQQTKKPPVAQQPATFS